MHLRRIEDMRASSNLVLKTVICTGPVLGKMREITERERTEFWKTRFLPVRVLQTLIFVLMIRSRRLLTEDVDVW